MAIMTFSEAVCNTVIEEMRRDKTIFTYGFSGHYWKDAFMDLSPLGYSGKAAIEEFGWDRIHYSGVCETQLVGAGVGAAMVGVRPVVNLLLCDFTNDAWGQVVVAAAKYPFKTAYQHPLPLILHHQFGGLKGTVSHSGNYHNWLANCPGLFVAVPSSPADARGLWRTALRESKDPVFMLSDSGAMGRKGPVPEGDYMIPFGKGEVKRLGKDITLAAVGDMVFLALSAAEDLAKEGIDVEVWDPRTLAPFDRESLINSVRKTGAMVVVDQAPKSFGATGEFMATVSEALTPPPPVARVAAMDTPVPASVPLYMYIYPNKEKIIKAVKDVKARKR